MAPGSNLLPVSLHCRVTVELVDSTGQAERGEFTLVTANQADFTSGLLDGSTCSIFCSLSCEI